MIERFKVTLKNWIRIKRLNVLLLFLFLALVISILAKLSNQVTQTLRLELVPIQLKSTEILTENKTKFVQVTIKAQGFTMLKYAFTELEMPLDFSQLKKDNSSYVWNPTSEDFSLSNFFETNVSVQSISPKFMTFNYDIQSTKKIPVVVNVATQFTLGYDMLTPLRSKPDSIALVGPKTSLDTIASVSTVDFSLTDIKKNINQTVALKLFPNLKTSVETVQVYSKVDKFTEGKINVPIQILNLPQDRVVSIFPKEIPVVFYTNLTTYDSITATDFKVVCDFSLLNSKSNLLLANLESYPKTIKSAALEFNKLEYVMTKKITKKND